MREFQERKKFRKIFLSKPAFALLLCLIVLLAFPIYRMYEKSRQAVLKNGAVENEIADLEQRKKDLEAKVDRLRSEAGVEKELRARFQIEKPGEKYVVILENPNQPPEKPAEQKPGFFETISNFFKSVF